MSFCWCFHFVFLLSYYRILRHYHSTTCNFTSDHSKTVESYISVANIVGKIQFIPVLLVFYCWCCCSFFFSFSVTLVIIFVAIISYYLFFKVYLSFSFIIFCFFTIFWAFCFIFSLRKARDGVRSQAVFGLYSFQFLCCKDRWSSIPAEQGARNCYCMFALLLVLFWCVFSGRIHIFTCYVIMPCNTRAFHVNAETRRRGGCFSCDSRSCVE
jgi:hypothetical protein